MQRRAVIAAVVALAAAAFVFALRPDTGPVEVSPGDDIRIKGSLVLEIFARRGGQGEPRAIDAARTLRPGDQLGFRAQATKAGHLLILGVDSQGQTYPVHPPGATPSAAPLAPSASAVTLAGAIEFDATAGTETLVALFCPTPVAYTAVAPRLANRVARAEALPGLSPECEQTLHRLEKTP